MKIDTRYNSMWDNLPSKYEGRIPETQEELKDFYEAAEASRHDTLMKTIDIFLSAFAPFMPFITEEVYQARPWGENNSASLHNTLWPEILPVQTENSTLYDYISSVAAEIRKAKTAAGVSQRTPVLKVTLKAPSKVLDILKDGLEDIENVGGIAPDALTFEEAESLSVEDISLDLSGN